MTVTMRRERTVRAVVVGAVVGAMWMIGCESPKPAPPVDISLSPQSATLTGVGQTVGLTAVVRVDGEIQSSPSVTWSSSNTAVATVSSSGTSATVTSVAAGSATITATSGGKSATSSITVVAAPTAAITLSAVPLSVAQRESGSGAVTIVRTNYTLPVTLTLEGLPAGVTGTFGPPQTNGNAESQLLTLTAVASAPVGVHTITVRGTGSGVTSVTTTFPLTVTAAAARSLTWNFCGAAGLPDWVAIQDGAGAWTPVTATVPYSYTFELASGRGGVAYVFHVGPAAFVSTFFGTTDEIIAHGNELCVGANGSGTFHTVNVAGLAPTDFVQGAMGRAVGVFTFTGAPTAQFFGVQGTAPNATTDLMAARSNYATVGGILTSTLEDVIIRRGIPIGVTPATIDFSNAEAFAPTRHTLTIQNRGTDLVYLYGTYQTANIAYGNYFANALQLATSTLDFPAIPAQHQQPGDRHVLRLSSRPPGDSLQTRYVYDVFKDAVSHTSTFGPSLSVPTITPARTGSTVGFTMTLAVQPEYNHFFTSSASQQSRLLFHSVQRTAAYDTPGTSIALRVPDFAGVAGFDAAWALATGVETWWNVSASRWTGGGPQSPPYDFINTPPYADGITYYAASRQGKLTP